MLTYAIAYGDEQHALRLLADCPNPFLVAIDGALSINPLRKVIGKPSAPADYKLRLRAEIQRRHLAIADESPTTYHDRKRWEAEIEYGPLFSAANWFNCGGDDAARMRTMAALIAEGSVIESRENGCKWSNVRLSPERERMIAEPAA